ncbi:threonine synthase [Candidatus Bipolaricaulota bacterium]|nr:threonine synthase [Candidatus Bipolaricaulota bacterium]
MAELFCFRCGPSSQDRAEFCERCGAPLSFSRAPEKTLRPADLRGRGVWRYSPFLPEVEPLTLGEGRTPLIPAPRLAELLGVEILLKLEGLNPTGSFKDRGAAVMVAVLRKKGAKKLCDDSSGNAGASLSAYAARAGIPARIFVPAYASGPKLRQIEAYGAELVRVPGPRPAATAALLGELEKNPDLVYASHNHSPYFLAGLRTLAYEIAEDLRFQEVDHVVVPVGGGALYLGLFYGFSELLRLGWVKKMPRIHAVQAAACAPIVRAHLAGEEEVEEVELGETVAEGVRIPKPARGAEILWALRSCGGEALAVTEEEIMEAQRELARKEGVYVEPTSALSLAGLLRLRVQGIIREGERVILPLTGSGLKSAKP